MQINISSFNRYNSLNKHKEKLLKFFMVLTFKALVDQVLKTVIHGDRNNDIYL